MAVLKMRAAAEYLGVSYRTLREYVAAGRIPAIQYPKPDGTPRRTKQFLQADLDHFIASNRGPEPGPFENSEPSQVVQNVAPKRRGRAIGKVYQRGWYQ